MSYFKKVFGVSYASNSTTADPGIITVQPNAAPSPSQQRQGSQTNVTTAVTTITDPLLLHLQELTAQHPAGVEDVPSSTSKRKSADAESILADVELMKQLRQGTGPLSDSVASLLSSYHSWHTDHLSALATNQAYINRTMDVAEARAARAVKHVQLQTVRLRTIAAGLSAAEGLPAMLANITATTAALEKQLRELEQSVSEAEFSERQKQ